MKWQIKVAGFKALSALPGGTRVYGFARKHLTRSLEASPARIQGKIGVGLFYLEWLRNHGLQDQLLQGVHLDFGTGWHPTIPLLYYSLGVKRQLLLDVAPEMDGSMLTSTAGAFRSLATGNGSGQKLDLTRLPEAVQPGQWRETIAGLGWEYHAPYAPSVGALEKQADVMTSTQVLLHVPPEDMRSCFRELWRMLKPGGLFLGTVHLTDIFFSAPGRTSGSYNFLRYSPTAWRSWFSSSLMSYNRARAREYRAALEAAGFVIREFEVEHASAEQLAELDRVPIDPSFKKYSREELADRHLFFVAQRP